MKFPLFVIHGVLLTANAFGASCTAPRPPKTFYVSPSGNDNNDGLSPATAFKKVQAGIDCLIMGGDRLQILPGVYTEFVRVVGKHGTPNAPIVIEGLVGFAPEPLATIQGSITQLKSGGPVYQFHKGSPSAPNNEWLPVGTGGEYISAQEVQSPIITDWWVKQGAFVDPINGRHTRLIAYDRIEDLRAQNETFETIIEGPAGCPSPDPRPGPVVKITSAGCTERRPWVYMGPGLWFDKDTNKVHIRLSHTHNMVPGLADYAGETDPNKVALAISSQNRYTVAVENSSNVQIRHLAVKFSKSTFFIRNSSNINLNNLTIWAGQYGISTSNVTGLTVSNCILDGGLPTWMFRDDVKGQYDFLSGTATVQNKRGKETLETLVLMSLTDTVEIRHSEFSNAHDVNLQATGVNFHHNWIGNLHDDALILDASAPASGLVHHNVIENSLSAISVAGDVVAGPWYIYRNLVDLRQPTAGFRPCKTTTDRARVWRPGTAIKGGSMPEGPYDVFHNTFVVPFMGDYACGVPDYPRASFAHLRNAVAPQQPRSSLNNIFVVLNREPATEAPLAFLLPPGAPARIDGDLFYRRGFGTLLFATPIPGNESYYNMFSCLPTDNCEQEWRLNSFFIETEVTNKPGYEANGVLLRDPRFMSWLGEPNAADDFRLGPGSPARSAGVDLHAPLSKLDLDSLDIGNPDVGAFQTSPSTGLAPKLKVGVGARKMFPREGPGN